MNASTANTDVGGKCHHCGIFFQNLLQDGFGNRLCGSCLKYLYGSPQYQPPQYYRPEPPHKYVPDFPQRIIWC